MKVHEPPMMFLDETAAANWAEGLANNAGEPYGYACYRFASEWATRMERAIADDGIDTTSPNVLRQWMEGSASKISHEADDEGITGFMYGCAVSIVAGCWKYGEQLRRWHNRDTQIGNEGDLANVSGGVLNPAILNIG